MKVNIIPIKLNPGDTIGIVSPSSPVTDELRSQFDIGVVKLEELGFKTKLASHVFSNTLGYSATAQEKADDMNKMFLDSSVQAIFCSQGGANANSVLPLLDYELITKNPKIFFGISDITVLLDGIYTKTGLVTFHGNDVMWGFGRNPVQYEIDELKRVLMEGQTGSVKKNSAWKTVRGGIVEGKLLGGNLTCLGKLIGTRYLPDFTNAILFLEDYGEETTADKTSYAFHHLDQAGILGKIKGLLLGYYKTKQAVEIEDIANEVINKYDFPIIKCNDFGHNMPNTILPIGVKSKLDADKCDLSFVEDYLK